MSISAPILRDLRVTHGEILPDIDHSSSSPLKYGKRLGDLRRMSEVLCPCYDPLDEEETHEFAAYIKSMDTEISELSSLAGHSRGFAASVPSEAGGVVVKNFANLVGILMEQRSKICSEVIQEYRNSAVRGAIFAWSRSLSGLFSSMDWAIVGSLAEALSEPPHLTVYDLHGELYKAPLEHLEALMETASHYIFSLSRQEMLLMRNFSLLNKVPGMKFSPMIKPG